MQEPHWQTPTPLPLVPLYGLESSHTPGRLPIHAHRDRVQLVYAVRGLMTLSTPAGRWVLPSGSALLVPAGTQHGLDIRRPGALRLLYIDPAFHGLPSCQGCTALQVTDLLKELIATSVHLPTAYDVNSPEARLAQVLVDQLKVQAGVPVYLPEPRDPRAVRLAELVRQDVGDKRPFTALASLAGVSTRTAERLFVNETGMSFGAWRTRQRLLTAIEHLATGESVAATSFAVGYNNPSNFITAFKAVFGKTPGGYLNEPAND